MSATHAPPMSGRGLASYVDVKLVAGLALAVVIGAVAGVGASFLVPKEYSASVTMLPARNEQTEGLAAIAGQFGGLASLAGIELGGDDDRNEAVATLRSKTLVREFVVEHKLLPVLFPKKWDAERGRWNVSDPLEVPTLDDAWRKFDRKVRSVGEDRRTGIVTLTITWRDPKVAAQWANELAMRVNREMRQRAIHEARTSLEYLDRELQKTRVKELREPIYKLIENRTNTVMLANVRDQYAFRIIDPASPPDLDFHSRPLRWLYALAGAVLGLFAFATWLLLFRPGRIDDQ